MNPSFLSNYSGLEANEEEEEESDQVRTPPPRAIPTTSMLVRMAMRVSRTKWFSFLRRVFHYQNGSRSNLGSNPFNCRSWMVFEFVALVLQICITLVGLYVSKKEKPIWPMRIWVVGYDFGCVMSIFILHWRYKHLHLRQGDDLEHQGANEDSRMLQLASKCRASLDLFFAMWFVMGNVWIFDSRFGSFNRAPKLHVLCIIILVWNAITYSFPFLLFLLLCILVPLLSNLIGYNMSLGSAEKGASEEQISHLLSWKYKQVDHNIANSSCAKDNIHECCCICLGKYKEKEEIRQLKCSHIFHQKCVDQWLKIISCCPLCKQPLDI